MSEFMDDILQSFYVKIHSFQENNWDFERYISLGKDADKTFFIDQCKYYLNFLFKNQEKLEYVYNLLADNESKDWLKNILLFRILGHMHFRLPTNNEQHWQKRQKAKQMRVSESNLNYLGTFGALEKYAVSFEGQDITLDCGWGNLAWTFLFKQYYLNRNTVKVQPELGDYIIDAGSCFGDTSLAFATSVRENGRIFSFEIEQNNLDIACYNLMQNESLAERIVISKYALSDTPESKLYLHGYGPGATISDKPSNTPITTTTIDHVVNEGSIDKVNFIKMDIEGSELQTLHGAVETIRKFRPKLAISIYHKPTDIFEIPIFIHRLDVGYQLFIDHYTIHNEETVLYAKVQ